MSVLHSVDQGKCLDALPPVVCNVLRLHPNKVCVAGGFIRAIVADEDVNDIDIFVDSEETARAVADEIKPSGGRFYETGKAITIRGMGEPAPQVIYKWTFEHPRDVIAAFDFSIAQAAIWWNGTEWESVCDYYFYRDVKKKALHYASPKGNDAAGTMLRVLKFHKLGYSIGNEALSNILAAMCEGMRIEILAGTTASLAEAFEGRFPKTPYQPKS